MLAPLRSKEDFVSCDLHRALERKIIQKSHSCWLNSGPVASGLGEIANTYAENLETESNPQLGMKLCFLG